MKTITLARKPLVGTVASNVLAHGSGGLNIDASRIGYGESGPDRPFSQQVSTDQHFWGSATDTLAKYKPSGRFPANLILQLCEDGCPVKALDEQSGILVSGTGAVKRQTSSNSEGNSGASYGAESRPEGTPMISYGDSGGASRFFKQVKK